MNEVTRIIEAKKKLRLYKENEERSYAWLSKRTGVSKSTLQRFVAEDACAIGMEFILKIEEFLDKEGY